MAMETEKLPLLGDDDLIDQLPTRLSVRKPLPWTRTTATFAVILIVGTTSSSLLWQHVTNTVPAYFFSISVFAPFCGFVSYTLIATIMHHVGWIKAGLTRRNFAATLRAMIPVALSFAIHNILTLYGVSGQAHGKPDVPTVLALIIQKLVVPVSLAMESMYERRYPRLLEGIGVALVMIGVVVAALTYRNNGVEGGHGPQYNAKLLCLVLASAPLAIGFLLVKRATRIVPNVTDVELWAVLCIPETIFSLGISYLAQEMYSYEHKLGIKDMTATLWTGIKCIAVGASPPDYSLLPCSNASKYTWLAFVPGVALNVTIPVLVRQLQDSTVIPLLRTVALPLATLVAMTHVDPVIATPFSWDGVFGMLFAFLGLLLCSIG